MRAHQFGIWTVLALVMAGCSSSSDSSGMNMKAPVITAVEPMDGELHIAWTNASSDCDAVEGERKSDMDGYHLAFTVAGSIDNAMDAKATENMTYTYRLRCKMGSSYSSYSSEKSANPHAGMMMMDGGM